MAYIWLMQCFLIFLGLQHPTDEKYNLRHPVMDPKQFAVRFDDISKILTRGTPEYCEWGCCGTPAGNHWANAKTETAAITDCENNAIVLIMMIDECFC